MNCLYCGKSAEPPHMDHVVPISRGGIDDPRNKVLACAKCNLEKSDRLPSEWLKVVPVIIAEIETRVLNLTGDRDRRMRGRKSPGRVPSLNDLEYRFEIEGDGYVRSICYSPKYKSCGYEEDYYLETYASAVESSELYWFLDDDGTVVEFFKSCDLGHGFGGAQSIVWDLRALRCRECTAFELSKLQQDLAALHWNEESRGLANAALEFFVSIPIERAKVVRAFEMEEAAARRARDRA